MSSSVVPLFIFALPRSGSTLSQRILAAHEEIATAMESHILLPFLYSLRDSGVYSKYHHMFAAMAIQDFCLALPNGVDDYLAETRALSLRLYSKAANSNVKHFMDKASPYYLTLEDIITLFPEAKFILLWRNPLAIVSSIMESWRKGRWNLYEYERTLFEGLPKLVAAYRKHAIQACAIRYEDLITNPNEELRRVFAYLELPFDPEINSGFANVHLKGRMGDQQGMGQYTTLSKDPLGKWKLILANPIRKAGAGVTCDILGKSG